MMKLIRTVATRRGRLRTDQHGMILVVTLLVVTMLGMLGSAFLTTSGTEHQIAKNDQELIQALYVAEGGLQAALNSLNLGLAPSTTGTIGPGQFAATVTNAPPPKGQKQLEVTGYVPTQGAPRVVKKLGVQVCCTSSFFKRALFNVSGDLTTSGNIIDSYDSALGAYGGSNASSNADVGGNNNMWLGSGTQIKGNATAHLTIDHPSYVTGTATSGAPTQPFTDVACPAGPYTPSVPSGHGIKYDPTKGSLQVSGTGVVLTLAAPGSYYFHDVSISGGGTLAIAAGGHVDIYISKDFTMSGGSVANNSQLPANLSIFGCGATSSGWTISGGSKAFFGLYAPHNSMDVSGSSPVYGSLVSTAITFTGSASLHYDQALARMVNSKLSITTGSWAEHAL